MAEQSRKFGHRARERRKELARRDGGGWEGRVVVARMHEAGDTSINTNQLSRYESGEGPLPREGRQKAFASALETDVEDLCAGPLAERRKAKDNDLMGKFTSQTAGADAADDPPKPEVMEHQLLAELAEVKVALEEQRLLLETVIRNQEAGG